MDLSKYGFWGQLFFRALAAGVILGVFWLGKRMEWFPPSKGELRKMLREECGHAAQKR